MPSLHTTKEQIRKQIESDLKASGLFTKHNFESKLSRIGTIIRAFANAILVFLDIHILRIYKAIHPHSATEEDLHEWLTRYGLEWKQATKARHNLRIGSVEQPSKIIQIPQGIIVYTAGDENERVKFQTITTGQISPSTPQDTTGRYTTNIVVECLEAGLVGNVVANSITEIENPPSGINVCYNPENLPLIAGTEKESIQSVRNRIYNYENSLGAKWTPDWYISEAEKFSFIQRAIFISSKKINNPGFVKLLLIGSSYLPVSNANLELLEEHFNSEDMNPGGSATVICENANLQAINRSIVIYFADSDSILTETEIMQTIEEYFGTLGAGDDFKESNLRYVLYNLPRVVQVLITPSGDVTIANDTIAVPGIIDITTLVYS